MKRALELSEAERRELHYERFHHPHPRVQLKMEVAWLKSQGLTHEETARLAGVDVRTVQVYLNEYEGGGIARLKEVRFYRPQSELTAHQETIETHLREHPPASINEAVAVIEKLTGIKRSPTQVRQFLESLGMKRLKTGVLPSKGDPDKQEAFKKKRWSRA
jgi:transposase